MLEGRVTIKDCGCWWIVESTDPTKIVRASSCSKCLLRALDFVEMKLYLDKVGSVSASDGDGDQLWLT